MSSLRTLEPKIPNMTPPTGSAGKPAEVPAGPKQVNPFSLSCRFDRARGEFVVHAGARAGGLAVVGLALLAGTALAFLLGTSFRAGAAGGGTPTAFAQVDAPTVISEPAQPRQSSAGSKPAAPSKQSRASRRPKSSSTGAPASGTPRQPGLNYLILKSCPSKNEATAAREALARKGVSTTVERDLPGWAKKGWYSLVGTTGFNMDRQRTAFDRHVKELKALKLDPAPYKWRGAEVASGRGD